MQTKPCPNCRAALFEDDDFCPKCGAVLDESLLADDELFAPKTEPAFALAPSPAPFEEPTFDGLLEELTGTFEILEAAHIMFAEVGPERRVDPDALASLSSVLAVRGDADPGRASLSPYEKVVLSLLNGNRSVARVAKKSGLGAGEVQRAIGVLAERGLIELRGELQPDVRGMLFGEMDDSAEITLPLPPLTSAPRTIAGVALLDSFSEELTAEINAGDDAAPPPVDDAASRAAPRFLGDRAVLVRAAREELGALWLSNLSKGGLFVESDTPPPAYTTVSITIETPEGSIELTGEVVHVQLAGGPMPGGAGIQLAPIAKEVRDRLENYIKGLAPLGGAAALAHVDPALLDNALAAARTLSNGFESGELHAALGLSPGATDTAMRARLDELRKLFEGPHPAATPPQAARCTNAIRLLATVADQIASMPPPPPMVAPAPLPVPTAEPAYVSESRAAPAASPSMAAWTSTSGPAPSIPGMPSIPTAPAPRPPTQPPRAAAPSAAPPAATPVNNAVKMRAMQLLESAVKELRAGKRTGALTYIRMAAEIAPDDPQVKALLAAWTGKG